ncbi:MAG: hypothetical protein ACLRZ9_02370 [Eubacterium sp.]
MVKSLTEIRYIKVESLSRDNVCYIQNHARLIARYILCHRKETLGFYTLDNHLLFYWEDSQLCVPDSVSVFYIGIEDYLERIQNALKMEQAVCPTTYRSVSSFNGSYLCLLPQKEQGDRNYNFLSADIRCSDEFKEVIDRMNISLKDIGVEVAFMLTTVFIGNNTPFSVQHFRYDILDFDVTLGDTLCYFDIHK